MANTEVILREKITGLGAEADVITVKAGYARNFLIPSGKAYEATKGNLRKIASLEASRASREAEELNGAQALATKISKLRPKFTLETGQGGKAFGSVTTMDLHKELEAKGIEVDRTAIKLEKPLKRSGKTEVEVKVHPEVTAILTVSVDAQEKERPAPRSTDSGSEASA